MPRFSGSPDPRRDDGERIGVLLVNSGSPDSAAIRDIRRFLGKLLSDPRVVELPRWLWLPILRGIILPIRPLRSAGRYRELFAAGRSPLLSISEALREGLAGDMPQRVAAPVTIAIGMLYSSPSIHDAALRLLEAGARRLLVIPLFPQYCGVTSGAVYDQVGTLLAGLRWLPDVRYVADYHDHASYIEALRASIAAQWATHGRTGHLVLSFHGIPTAYCDKGDPYRERSAHTSRLLAEALSLRDDEWTVAFQSRFGPGNWLQPYTEDILAALPARGVRTATVACQIGRAHV